MTIRFQLTAFVSTMCRENVRFRTNSSRSGHSADISGLDRNVQRSPVRSRVGPGRIDARKVSCCFFRSVAKNFSETTQHFGPDTENSIITGLQQGPESEEVKRVVWPVY